MKNINLDYGNSKISFSLPNSSVVVEYGKTYEDPPIVDPITTTKEALNNPLNFSPLKDLAGPNKTAVIVFPDRVKGGAHEFAHRKVSIPLIIEELISGGCKIENISLVCAQGLHRKNTYEEWLWYLGPEIVNPFWPDRIINHDAEDKSLLELGQDEMGNTVQTNKFVANADIPILIGHCAANPYGGFSGGYKMLVTGLSGQNSIKSHHTPKTMHRGDWLGGAINSHMRNQFQSIGEHIERKINKNFFAIDAVVGQKSQILSVKAGKISEVEKATWPLAKKRSNILLEELNEPADILLIGLPRDFHYGPGMGTNPILMGLAIGAQYSRCANALRPDSVIIAASLCDGWFNKNWFPSYEQTYNSFGSYATAADFLDSIEAQNISRNNEFLFSYSNFFTYHPFHAMSMISGASVPLKWCSQIYVIGAEKPAYARGMGFRTLKKIEDAIQDAKKYVGSNPRILCTPECFSGGVAVNLSARN